MSFNCTHEKETSIVNMAPEERRESVTAYYLKASSTQKLQEERSEVAAIFADFMSKCSLVVVYTT